MARLIAGAVKHPSGKPFGRRNFIAVDAQLEIRKQGAKVWSRRRKESASVCIDLRVAKLSGAGLTGAKAGRTSLRRANLRAP